VSDKDSSTYIVPDLESYMLGKNSVTSDARPYNGSKESKIHIPHTTAVSEVTYLLIKKKLPGLSPRANYTDRPLVGES
jgi:hypothetical protein